MWTGIEKKKLPVGIENFEKIRTEGFYYVDKSMLIQELLHKWGEVNLFITGLNNPKVFSVTTVRFDEYFGFTDPEVREMLGYYGLDERYEAIKDWYDGYRFGNVDVYCPWDVINYCDELTDDPSAEPKDYWSNTSGNDVVRHFMEKVDQGLAKSEVEALVAGETVVKELHEELTYHNLYDSIENLWSVLFTTGYLTRKGGGAGRKPAMDTAIY